MYSYDTFLSPATWRYGSPEMRTVFSEIHKRQLMRQVWVALATAQEAAGLVAAEQLADLRAHVDDVDIERAHEIEKETRHDVMAEIKTFAEQCEVGGGIIHWGATSADITDNADALRYREAARLIEKRLVAVLDLLAAQIEKSADLPVMAHTHIQPAEPTTLGYRFAVYAQDLLHDLEDLRGLIGRIRGKGLKGAVGTQAGYDELLHGSKLDALQMEEVAMQTLGIAAFPIATQTYTRQQDVRILNALAGIAGSLHKFAYDFRILQSPPFGEWAEPFGKNQVGSSAMPFKRNPINTENICSLARYVAAMPAIAWNNASQAILERSLDDSANRRFMMPEAFLLTDEMLRRMTKLLADMRFDEVAMRRNLDIYGPFAATERVLMAMVAQGASRQEAHEWLRNASLQAWAAMREGEPNPLVDLLTADPDIRAYLKADEITALMQADAHVGTAPARARAMAQMVRDAV